MSSKTGFPTFKRSTLWIIIIILIPVIGLLNRAGEPPEIEDTPTTVQQFPIEQLDFNTLENNAWVSLPGSGLIYLTVASDRIPKNRIKLPDHQDFRFSIRNDKALTQVAIPAEQAALEVTLDFLRDWLPPVTESDQLIATGEVSQELTLAIRRLLTEANGDSIPLTHESDQYITRIPVPEMGSTEQLAFLIAAEILKQRATGYDVRFQWDHRDTTSYLSTNTTIHPDWLGPAEPELINSIREQMVALAARTERTAAQIHRYLVTMAIYDLPEGFIQNQADLLASISNEQVNQAIRRFGVTE